MANKKYTLFLEKIIYKTKTDEITWSYLDSDQLLCEAMRQIDSQKTSEGLWGMRKTEYREINKENSFYTEIEKTYVVILTLDYTPATIYVIPNTFKNIVILPPETYGSLITRLLNIVQEQFPNAERFITDFLAMDE